MKSDIRPDLFPDRNRRQTAPAAALRKVGQLSVHLKNGRVLYLHDRRAFLGCPWEGLYLGGDGSVIMAVESEELPDGTEEIREAVRDDAWGTRMTYIPASEIARVNIRIK